MISRMQYVYGLIGLIFLVTALLHVPHPSPYLWVPYAAGAVLALLSLIRSLSVLLSRVLAVAATALMFFFFAGFFTEVPKLESDWYQGQEGWAVVSLLFGAFALIPVLSDYSCRCKAACRNAHDPQRHSQRQGFFSVPEQQVPDHLPPRGS